MYKACKNLDGTTANCIVRTSDGACIPFDPANTDYQTFKADLAKGAELQDADGTAMTADQITTFLGTLP